MSHGAVATLQNMICKESQYNNWEIVDTFSVSSNGLNKWRFSNDIKHRHIVLTVVDTEMCLFFISYNAAVASHVLFWTSLVIWYIYLTRLYENKRGLSTRSVSIQFPWITSVSGNKIHKKVISGELRAIHIQTWVTILIEVQPYHFVTLTDWFWGAQSGVNISVNVLPFWCAVKKIYNVFTLNPD